MKKTSFEEAKRRFVEQGREDIELLEENYKSWKRDKATFFDKIIGEIFWASPQSVYNQQSMHPKRSLERRRQTNLGKYGNVCSLHGNETEEKTKKTNLEKYGTEYASQSSLVRNKIRNTNLEKYGVENPSQIEEIKEKKRNTCLGNYGTNYPSQSDEIKFKMKQSSLLAYGTEYPSQNKAVKEKTKKTLQDRYSVSSPFQLPDVMEKAHSVQLERYGVEHYWARDTKKITETGQPVHEWYALLSEPKPAYGGFLSPFKGAVSVSLRELEELMNNYKNHKSKLEVLAEKVLGISVYNRKPAEISVNYRPDFKLSETVYANVDGLYWHSEHQKDKKYHLNLRKEFEKNNLTIFQFREDEIFNKPSIVKSIVANKLGQCSVKLMARKTVVKVVSRAEAKVFLAENYLMGTVNAKHIGLYDKEDKLVSLLSYKRRKTAMNVERYCSALNCSISGGFSKLLSYLERNCLSPNIIEIHNWVDLRYGTGTHLLSKGFTQRTETLGWSWTDGTNVFNRLKCKDNMDARKLPEKKHAEELGWYRIYDAGQRLYIKTLL